MSKNEFSFNINNKNLSKIEENFSNLKEEESAPINPLEYKISIQDSRSLIINWISFLCSKLNFRIIHYFVVYQFSINIFQKCH